MKTPDSSEVRAAGALPWRRAEGGGIEVAIIHRPRYDDWSFPKGHLEPGETWEQAACREVAEETGFSGDLGRELSVSRYEDRHGRPKVVRWWEMRVTSGAFSPNDEVDELRWLSSDDLARMLTYEDDRRLLAELVKTASV